MTLSHSTSIYAVPFVLLNERKIRVKYEIQTADQGGPVVIISGKPPKNRDYREGDRRTTRAHSSYEAENIVEEKLGSSSDDNREPEILVYPVSYRTGGGGL